MQEFSRNFRFAIRQMWKWWETYVIITCFTISMAFVIGGVNRQMVIHDLRQQIEAINGQNAQSIQDREYLHRELRNTRSALKRLETKVKTNK